MMKYMYSESQTYTIYNIDAKLKTIANRVDYENRQ
jgi:hypothetical protein